MNNRKEITLCYLLFSIINLTCIHSKDNDTSFDFLYYGIDNGTTNTTTKLSNTGESGYTNIINSATNTNKVLTKSVDDFEEEYKNKMLLLYNNTDLLALYLDTNSTSLMGSTNEELSSSCYNNLETLNHDMYMEALLQLKKEDKQEENSDKYYEYIICPNTIITISNDIQQEEKVTEEASTSIALIPTLSNMKIKCGNNGSINNRCVINGGIYQVLFHPKIIVQNVNFYGIQFINNSKGVSIAGWGHPLSSAFFYGCRWFVSYKCTSKNIYFNTYLPHIINLHFYFNLLSIIWDII